MPRDPGHANIEQGRVEGAALQGADRGRAVGADGHLVTQARQFHLHQVPEVGLVIREQDPQAPLARLLHHPILPESACFGPCP